MKAIEKIIAITSPTDVVVNDGNTFIQIQPTGQKLTIE